jgi:hypothetical protein
MAMRVHRRAAVLALVALAITAGLAMVASPARAGGADFSIDFVAAGPFSYDHDAAAGGEYGDGTISETDGVVESLSGADFQCGDSVLFMAAVEVDEGASGEQDIEIDFGFLAEPTGQPGVGFSDLLSASPGTGDGGMSGETGDTAVSIQSESIDTSGAQDTLEATVRVVNLDAGETFVLRLPARLTCVPDSDPTGVLQAEIRSARVVAPAEDAIAVGDQTIPFRLQGRISSGTAVDVTKSCPGSATVGDTISYVITVTNTGDEGLKGIKVLDSILGDLSGSYDDVLGVGESETHSFTYVSSPDDPDRLVNVVTVKTEGIETDESVDDTDSCVTVLVLPVTEQPAQPPEVEVLPRTFLPETGAGLPGLGAVGLMFVMLGTAMIALSRRPAYALFPFGTRGELARRLSRRRVWTAAHYRVEVITVRLLHALCSRRGVGFRRRRGSGPNRR